MITHTYRILIGAHGWLHPEWQTQFYPDDLPEDWQLGYYSNEFPIVLMPASYIEEGTEDLQAWLEDSNDNLRMVCEIPSDWLQQPAAEATHGINQFIESIAVLGDRCVGLLLRVTEIQGEIETVLAGLTSPLPLCIEGAAELPEDKINELQKVCEKLKLGFCWQGEGDVRGLTYGQLAMTRINSQGMDMRQLRNVVETILQTTTLEQTNVLIFDGHPPDLEAIRHAGVILDLF